MLKLLIKLSNRLQFQSRKSQPKAGDYLSFSLSVRFFVMIALSAALFFIADNVGCGWVYLMSASLLATIILSWFLPFLIINTVRVSQGAIQKATVGETLAVTIRLGLNNLIGTRIPVQWLRLKYDFSGSSTPETKPIFIENLLGWLTIPWIIRDLKRGVHRLGTVAVETSFPLGFVWFRRQIVPDPQQTITVYPRTVAIEGFFLYRLPAATAGVSGTMRGNRAARASTHTRGLREYVRGDSPRHVHWPSSAKLGHLMVREFETEGLPLFDVFLDLEAPWQNETQFELAVTTCASLIALGHQLGTSPQLVVTPESAFHNLNLPPIAPGIGAQMEILARVMPLPPVSQLRTHSAKDKMPFESERALVVVSPSGFAEQPRNNTYLIEVGTHEGDQHSSPASSTTFSTTVLHRSHSSLIFNADDLTNL